MLNVTDPTAAVFSGLASGVCRLAPVFPPLSTGNSGHAIEIEGMAKEKHGADWRTGLEPSRAWRYAGSRLIMGNLGDRLGDQWLPRR